jgi:hypothetical protein
MKRRSVPLRAALYTALLAAMAYSAVQLYVPKADAYGVCCTYSKQCADPNHSMCCAPPTGATKCSPTQPNYCQLFCEGPAE